MTLQHCLHITKPYLMQISKIPLCTIMRVTRGATLVFDFQILYEPLPVVDNALAFDKTELFCNRLVV